MKAGPATRTSTLDNYWTRNNLRVLANAFAACRAVVEAHGGAVALEQFDAAEAATIAGQAPPEPVEDLF